jgi:hypothetical protein
MYAIVRRYAYDPAAIASAGQALAAAQELHTPQPGYAGSIVVDDGQHFIAVNLWQSEHDAAAGRAAIGNAGAAPARATDGNPFPAAGRRRSGGN